MRKRHRLAVNLGLMGLMIISMSGVGMDLLYAYPPNPAPAATSGIFEPNVPSYMDLVRNFDYNNRAPLDIREQPIAESDSLIHLAISYTNPRRWRVVANLLKPTGTGPFAALVYLCGNSDARLAFLEEAYNLVKTGVAVLIIDTSVRQVEPNSVLLDINSQTIQSVLDIRRAIDCLSARPEIDPRRIGFIGYADGANLGGIIAGVEKRIRALILISANVCPSKSESNAPSAFLDGLHYIGYAAPANLLLQYSEQGDPVSRETAMQCYQAASQPKALSWYSANPLTDPQARCDRYNWLREQLGIYSASGVSAGDLLESSR